MSAETHSGAAVAETPEEARRAKVIGANGFRGLRLDGDPPAIVLHHGVDVVDPPNGR